MTHPKKLTGEPAPEKWAQRNRPGKLAACAATLTLALVGCGPAAAPEKSEVEIICEKYGPVACVEARATERRQIEMAKHMEESGMLEGVR